MVESLVKKALPEHLPHELVDTLGLTYPRVAPPEEPFPLRVNKIVVRSISHYMFKESGYVIEISIYREWENRNTSPDPTVLAGVSLFHRNWDLEMESIEGTTKERKWDPQLRNFLPTRPAETDGVSHFFDAVRQVQGFLSEAAKAFESH